MKNIICGLVLLSFSVVAMHEGKKGLMSGKTQELRFGGPREHLNGAHKDRISREEYKKLVALAKLASTRNNGH